MAPSLTITPAAAATPISNKTTIAHSQSSQSVGFHKVRACQANSKPVSDAKIINRRSVSLGLTAASGAVFGMNIGGQNAIAARRPPPPPPVEKRDPSLSALQAKVLASKKRKEALKQSAAEEREKGKAISESSPPPPE